MASSSAQMRRLGAELRRLRELTGRTQGDLGQVLGRTHASLVNWERGKTRISKSDLAYLLAELRAPAEVRRGLEELRVAAQQTKSPWGTFGLPDWLRPIMSFEEDAVQVQTFQPVLVPGLFQTEEYARAIHQTGRHKVDPEFVERWVAARMRRQLRLNGAEPLRVHAVIPEATLRLEVGGPKVLVKQVARLHELSQLEHVTLQVLAADRHGYGGVASNFMVLHFAEPELDPPLGCFDGPLGGYMISEEGDVATLVAMFQDLSRLALSPEDSTELLAKTLADQSG
ncbi:helix-turn-helix transcriptional regulator [Streptomyces sp. DSM 44915]|uniref:Helix-turn-helix transcriptional regulator n=1 Tax=Streptomyces chisholmiae TaxID=3075540 RepID=A0ABU2JTU6_9ACTN|nr:helix-turn-helix transcriptional regulator [Streptomyces sp. DSM 44915]MDT0268168.1 helix-turn-helix transcriptional regulator [Streptomyces sp. DSM 44915]